MKLTINGVSISINNITKEIVINGNDVSASFINECDGDLQVYTKENPKLVEYYTDLDGQETFTGVVKDKYNNMAYYSNGVIEERALSAEYMIRIKDWVVFGKPHQEGAPAFENM